MTLMLKPLQGGRPIVLDKPILLVGRHPDCDVVIEDSAKISRKHCCIALADNRFLVRDLDSTNGVFVNGRRTDQCAELKPGDRLIIGDVPFELVAHGVSAAPPKAAPTPRSQEPSTSQSSKLRLTGSGDVMDLVRQHRADAAIEFTKSFNFPATLRVDQEDEDLIRQSDG